jgi:hypothetical protein
MALPILASSIAKSLVGSSKKKKPVDAQKNALAIIKRNDEEKNRVDLERLIATLRVDGDFQTDTVKPDSSPQQSVADSSPSLDNTLQQSFANLTSSVEILRQDVDELYQAFYLSQQGRQNILRQEDRSLFKEEDALQKNIGKEKSGGLSKAMKRDPNKRQQDLEREVGKKRKAILKGLGLGLLSSFGMALGTSVIGGVDAGATSSSSVGELRSGQSPGSTGLNVQGGGGRVNLTDEQYKYLAYAISGEAGPGDDQYAVAASILNRVAEGKGTVEQIIKAPGQYKAYEDGKMKYSPEIEARLKSPEGQAKLVAALEALQGRTDFKGQSQLHNRVASEDPMYDSKGNFFHYSYQTGPNSVRPDDFQMPNYQQFILTPNKPDPTGPQSSLSPNLNFRPVVLNESYETASLQSSSTANIASINLPPQIIDGGTSGGQQRGQARAEGPPSVHSTTNNTMFGNVIANRFLSVVV